MLDICGLVLVFVAFWVGAAFVCCLCWVFCSLPIMGLIVLVFFVGLVFVYYGGSLGGAVTTCFGIWLRCVSLSLVLWCFIWRCGLFGLCCLLDWLVAVCFGVY